MRRTAWRRIDPAVETRWSGALCSHETVYARNRCADLRQPLQHPELLANKLPRYVSAACASLGISVTTELRFPRRTEPPVPMPGCRPCTRAFRPLSATVYGVANLQCGDVVFYDAPAFPLGRDQRTRSQSTQGITVMADPHHDPVAHLRCENWLRSRRESVVRRPTLQL